MHIPVRAVTLLEVERAVADDVARLVEGAVAAAAHRAHARAVEAQRLEDLDGVGRRDRALPARRRRRRAALVHRHRVVRAEDARRGEPGEAGADDGDAEVGGFGGHFLFFFPLEGGGWMVGMIGERDVEILAVCGLLCEKYKSIIYMSECSV